FKGKYKVEQGGDLALSQLKTRLFQLVQPNSTDTPTSLHPDFWQSKAPGNNRRMRQIPLWLPISALSTLGALFFLGLYFNLNTQ
ncbi:DotU family type IV/VI secretion system protein, partial [Vibrio vulnificus]